MTESTPIYKSHKKWSYWRVELTRVCQTHDSIPGFNNFWMLSFQDFYFNFCRGCNAPSRVEIVICIPLIIASVVVCIGVGAGKILGMWKKMTSTKSVSTLTSGAIFVKSKHTQRFCECFHIFHILTKFPQILPGF